MIIENLTKEVLTYRAHGNVIRLNPGLNEVKDNLIKSEEITRHFGTLINVYITNATLLANQQEVKDEEPIIEDNDLAPAGIDNADNESDKEQEVNEPVIDNAREEQDMACGDDGCAFDQMVGEDKATEVKDEPAKEDSQEESEEPSVEEKEPEEIKPALDTLKRGELLDMAKELNLEFKGNISNANLIKLIEEAQK